MILFRLAVLEYKSFNYLFLLFVVDVVVVVVVVVFFVVISGPRDFVILFR